MRSARNGAKPNLQPRFARERFYNRVEDKIEKHENKIEARMDRSDGEIALLAAADSEIRGSVQNIEGYLAALLKKPLPKG